MAERFIAYGLMIAIIAALAAIYKRGVKPIEKTVLRFAAAFRELYEFTVCSPVKSNVLYIEKEDGSIALLSRSEQPQEIQQAFARCSNEPRAKELLDIMESAVRECFEKIGTSDRYRKRYYVPLNELYTITYLFYSASVTPERITTRDELKDVESFLKDFVRLCAELEKKISK